MGRLRSGLIYGESIIVKKLVALLAVLALTAIAAPAGAHQPHSRTNPVLVGTPHYVGDDWRVKVVEDRWKIAADKYGKRPAAGYDFVVVKVRAARLSGGEGDAFWDLNFDLFGGKSKRLYSAYNGCFSRNGIIDKGGVYPGGAVTGTVCFRVPESDGRFKLRVEDSMEWDANTTVWYKTT